MNLKNFPLENLCTKLMGQCSNLTINQESIASKDLYLDVAEKIVRHLIQWQDNSGILEDPYSPYEMERSKELFGTARFAGAVAQLIKAGRCMDLRDSCIKATDCCLSNMNKNFLAPEFWIKELVYSWEALEGSLTPKKLKNWKTMFNSYAPEKCYYYITHNVTNNLPVFAMLGEFLKYKAGLNADISIVDEIIEQQINDGLFSSYGLYKEDPPRQPLTYSFVVNQQIDLLLHAGYDGIFVEELKEISKRAGWSAMLTQSVTGQAPFGGRSNQFNFVEGHLACFFETRASYCYESGEPILAGMYKRAAKNALKCIIPWILDSESPKLMKNKFPDQAAHGIDSGGTYTVYLSLTASLFATAYHLANDSIPETSSPAEMGGFVFELQEGFHKVFANCSNYYLEIDTKVDTVHRKESTGLGRIQKKSIPGETALSSSIVANPDYTISSDIVVPDKNLALGPCWYNAEGKKDCLANYGEEIKDTKLNIIQEGSKKIVFTVSYKGDFDGINEICEHYELDMKGIKYEFNFENHDSIPFINIPLLETNGSEKTSILQTKDGFIVAYGKYSYIIKADSPQSVFLLKDAALANKNGLYKTGTVSGNNLFLSLQNIDI